MGRRWGKSIMAGTVALAAANAGAAVAWIAPTYKNTRALWRFAESIVAPVGNVVDIRKSDKVIAFPSGGWLGIFSADAPDGVRGEAFDLAVVDEAARITEEAWQDAIQPTLADRAGRAMLISTPKRKNWFYVEYTKASTGNGTAAKAWNASSYANPNPNIRAAYLLAASRVPAKTYRQEWQAQFVEDGGEVFRNVRDRCTLAPIEEIVREGGRYVFGVDWGRTDDSTVISAFDIATQQQVYLDRFTDIGYELQTGRLRAAFERFNPSAILAEANSMGGPLIEQMQALGLPVQPYWMSNDSKTQLISDFALALEVGSIRLLNDAVLTAEMEAYEEQKTPTGKITYNAPKGIHDDTVIATALSYRAATTGGIFA